MAGDLYDLDIGPDELSGVKQWVRIEVVEHYVDQFNRIKMRFRAVGGGRTNVPRWRDWPTLVFDVSVVKSMMDVGQLIPCVSDAVGEPSMT